MRLEGNAKKRSEKLRIKGSGRERKNQKGERKESETTSQSSSKFTKKKRTSCALEKRKLKEASPSLINFKMMMLSKLNAQRMLFSYQRAYFSILPFSPQTVWDNEGARRKAKRVGRGPGSGKG